VKVLVLHDRYRLAGGEDAVVHAELELLASRGHAVRLLEVSNERIGGLLSQVRAAGRAVYSLAAEREVAAELARVRPDVVHVHNFFPLLSPSVYRACRRAGVAVVQTLHNFRLLCPNGILFRDGSPCHDCMGRAVAWPGVLHRCYRASAMATAPVAAMLAVHRALGTFTDLVDVYVAPTRFVRDLFVRGGFPADRIEVKPHFVPGDPVAGDGRGGYALAVGRLSEEKGFRTLLAAWGRLRGDVPLKVVGDGPLRDELRDASRAVRGIEWVGRAPPDEVRRLMQGARILLVPSLWYETFGLVVIEAFAAALPVVAARHGALAELVEDGVTGALFEPGDAADLAAAVERLAARPGELAAMRRNARAEFEAKYDPARNAVALLRIYAGAVARARARAAARPVALGAEEGARWTR
jgi:glycosyltransferase involved in cell wall biosynthesis